MNTLPAHSLIESRDKHMLNARKNLLGSMQACTRVIDTLVPNIKLEWQFNAPYLKLIAELTNDDKDINVTSLSSNVIDKDTFTSFSINSDQDNELRHQGRLLFHECCTLTPESVKVIEHLCRMLANQITLLRQQDLSYELIQLFQQTHDANNDSVFVKDEQFRIVMANSAFMSMYPSEQRDKVIGYTTLEQYRPDEVEAFLVNDKKAFELGSSEVVEKLLMPNGRMRTFFTVKTRFESENGELYILGVARDVSEKENLIDALQRSNKNLDDFAMTASHDLRAPLNAIRGLMQLVEMEESLSEEGLTHIGMVFQRIASMESLLSDLMLYSKVGRENHQYESMSLTEVVETCRQRVDLPSGFDLTCEHAEFSLPRFPLTMILTNLISNAAKHHDKKLGNISVKYERLQAEHKIMVIDDGPGIPEDQKERIFERFTRLSQTKSRGAGFGLALVKKVMDHYQGKIEVSDNQAQGACFTLYWPINNYL